MKAASSKDSKYTRLALLLSALVVVPGCTGDDEVGVTEPSTSDADASVVRPPPTPEEVGQQLTVAYVHPEQHAITALDTGSPELMAWRRTYGGIDMLVDPKSVM